LKRAVLAPLGYSPPVITEFIQYLEEAENKHITDLNLLLTTEPPVQQGAELIKITLKNKYPHIHIHTTTLPFNDIQSQKDSLEFMKICAKTLKELREIHKTNEIYLCVAGGRKDMCIILTLLGQLFQINGVYHIIMTDIKTFNIHLERMRKHIEELAKTQNKQEYYQKHKKEFDELMFPHPSTYTVIQIPTLPYPQNTLNQIKKLLTKIKTPKNKTSLPIETLTKLQTSGKIRITKNYIYTTQLGQDLGKILQHI